MAPPASSATAHPLQKAQTPNPYQITHIKRQKRLNSRLLQKVDLQMSSYRLMMRCQAIMTMNCHRRSLTRVYPAATCSHLTSSRQTTHSLPTDTSQRSRIRVSTNFPTTSWPAVQASATSKPPWASPTAASGPASLITLRPKTWRLLI